VNRSILAYLFVFIFAILHPISASAQQPADSINKKRLRTVIIGSSAAYAASMTVLYFAWYKDNLSGNFSFIDDSDYWLQVDKVGHATTAYTLSNYGYWMLRWAGVNEKKSTWYGTLMGWGSMTVIEILDGFSNEYGASASDLVANTLGCGLFLGQQLLWHDQRFRLKFSYHPTEYAQYNPSQLGENHLQRILKDYNGQTYWLSANIHSFIRRDTWFPAWINVSVGYGADGMLAAVSNPKYDSEGNPIPEFNRIRQYYLSMDIDWTRIKTNSGFLKFTFKLLSFIKLPFPTVEYNNQDGVVWHWIYF
jgi:hypothetical protein